MNNARPFIYGAAGTIFLAMAASSMWFMYKELSRVQHELHEIKSTQTPLTKIPLPSVLADVEVSPAKRQKWSHLQSQSQNAVLQVFTQSTEFNWVEPYKTPNQNESRGSAFFINDSGDIITNAHVINQAISVMVQVPSVGKRRFDVQIIGVSPERDLALLRMGEKDLALLKKELGVEKIPYLLLGDSDLVQRGDKIMTLGFPLGQEGLKSTTGIVSGREHIPMTGYFIQISAPINPGNSGGPSVDNKGRVVGVNSAGVMGAQNVGYIIPANEVLLFLDQLDTITDTGTPKLLRKPFLGVFFNSANDNLTTFLKNPEPGGLYVVDVYKGSPFDKAGIQAGDMIYSIDNYAVDIYGEMSVPWSKEDRISIIDYVARLKLGHDIKLVYYRKGAKHTANLTLTQTEPPIRRVYPGFEKVEYDMLAGLVIMPLTVNHVMLLAKYAPKLMEFADSTKPIEPALLITHVLLNSPASRLRTIGVGGIISEVNGKKVQTLADFKAALPASIESGYLTIKTTDNQFAAIPVKEILADEERLSTTYFYPISESFKDLKRLADRKIGG